MQQKVSKAAPDDHLLTATDLSEDTVTYSEDDTHGQLLRAPVTYSKDDLDHGDEQMNNTDFTRIFRQGGTSFTNQYPYDFTSTKILNKMMEK